MAYHCTPPRPIPCGTVFATSFQRRKALGRVFITPGSTLPLCPPISTPHVCDGPGLTGCATAATTFQAPLRLLETDLSFECVGTAYDRLASWSYGFLLFYGLLPLAVPIVGSILRRYKGPAAEITMFSFLLSGYRSKYGPPSGPCAVGSAVSKDCLKSAHSSLHEDVERTM